MSTGSRPSHPKGRPTFDSLNMLMLINFFVKEYLDEILHKSESEFDLLMAHPKANGFLGAKGFAGGIPYAYTHIAKKFFNKIKKYGLQDRYWFLFFKGGGRSKLSCLPFF